MQRCFTNILSSNVEQSAEFYEKLLNMKRHFDSDWFVILTHKNIEGLELGLLQRDHEFVPKSLQIPPSGIMITFVVDDCDDIHQKAKSLNTTIIEAPKDMPYGQRRMLIKDPDGTVIDISSPTVKTT